MNTAELNNRIANAKARIRTIRNSNIPASDKRFLIDNWRQLIETNKQLVEVLGKANK